MSKTWTVSDTSCQRSTRQQEQQVNWGRDRNNGQDGPNKNKGHPAVGGSGDGNRIAIQKGYRLGGSGSTSSVLSAISENSSRRRIESKEEMFQQNGKQNKRGGGQEVMNEGDGGRHSRTKLNQVNSSSNNDIRGVRPFSDAGTKENRAEIPADNSNEVQKEKLPIEDYYSARGADYRRIRKGCKDTVPRDGQFISVDYYVPPKGYTDKDLPPASQGLSQSMEEHPVSPAVILASKSKRKLSKEMPKDSADEFIKQMKNGQRKKTEKLPAVNTNEELSSKSVDTAAAPVPNIALLNGSFPDDSFNELELVLASQQVENQFAVNQNAIEQGPSTNDVRKRDVNGKSKNAPNNPCNSMADTTPRAPFTSTPVPNTQNKLQKDKKDTPKSRGCGLSRTRSKTNLNRSNNMSMFENSDTEMSPSKVGLEEKESETETPRKLLKFDESPIKHISNNNADTKSGDYRDDEDDHYYSQIEMPGEKMKPPEQVVQQPKLVTGNGDKTTLLLNNTSAMESFSFMDEDELAAIEKLEAMHCRSASTSSNSSSSITIKTSPAAESSVIKGTQRTRRRLGLTPRPKNKKM